MVNARATYVMSQFLRFGRAEPPKFESEAPVPPALPPMATLSVLHLEETSWLHSFDQERERILLSPGGEPYVTGIDSRQTVCVRLYVSYIGMFILSIC